MNELFYGDNLAVLRKYIEDETADLIYLDPPFNSNQDYNVLFKEHDGVLAAAQIKAFSDTWRWDLGSQAAYEEVVESGGRAGDVMQAFRTFLGDSDMMAYLAMMAPRLQELHRVLKPTGSLYLHCDPTASHYLKLLLDAVFQPQNFRSEIIWKRSSAHSDTKQGRKQHGRIHDVILFYTKSEDWTWNPVYTPYDPEYIESSYGNVEPGTGRRFYLGDITGPGGAAKGNPKYQVLGVTRYWRFSRENMQQLIDEGRIVQAHPGAVPRQKRYLDEMPGVPLQDVWTDIKPIGAQAAERLGYPTQKPLALLRRIINSSSKPGDVVLDPFCGCGTAVDAAEELGRAWIGIDITHLAISLIKSRLHDVHGAKAAYVVTGEPPTIEEARKLAADDPLEFQNWVLGRVFGRRVESKKGADKGIDGKLIFHDEPGKTKHAVISVKGGATGPTHLRDLRGVVDREKAQIGVLITLSEPTRKMREEAASAGFYQSPFGKFPKLQLLTVDEIFEGKGIEYPHTPGSNVTIRQAPRRKKKGAEQPELPLLTKHEGGGKVEEEKPPRAKRKRRA